MGIRERAGSVVAALAGRLSAASVSQAERLAAVKVERAERDAATFRSRYDAARTTADNAKHWANADHLAAVSALTPEVRRTLRIRSRYEVQNNCYAAGLVSTLAGDVVGTGPRLQVRTGDQSVNAAVEAAWLTWVKADGLVDKLRVLERSKITDGEGFALFAADATAVRMNQTPVQLSVRLVEADQVADPWYSPAANPLGDDGIVCDAAGNVVEYHVARKHPGDARSFSGLWEFDRYPASQVIHWFRADRPGQLRGAPELTPALPLFAQLRRFTLATLTAAEVAAMMAGVMETSLTADEMGGIKTEAFDAIEMVKGMLLTVPQGWKASQFEAKHPTTQYQQFVNCILREIGRCLDVPYGIVAGDCTLYNYSSARLDFQAYDLRRDGDRSQHAIYVMSRIFLAFLAEARRIPGVLPPGVPAAVPHDWHFDRRPSIDPVKDATASDMELTQGTTSLVREARARGVDLEDVVREQAAAIAIYKRHGVPLPASLGGGLMKPPALPTAKGDQADDTTPAGTVADDAPEATAA